MSESNLVAFIIAGGLRVGFATIKALSIYGYKVAITSRRPDCKETEVQGWLSVGMEF